MIKILSDSVDDIEGFLSYVINIFKFPFFVTLIVVISYLVFKSFERLLNSPIKDRSTEEPNDTSSAITSETVMIDIMSENPLIGICYNSNKELYYVWYEEQYIGSDFTSVREAIQYCRDNFSLFIDETLNVDNPIPMPDPDF